LFFFSGWGILSAQNFSSPSVDAKEASSPTGARVEFHYENAQLQPAKYSFVIFESGAGEFHSEPGATPPEDSASYHPLPDRLDRSVQLSKATTAQIFATARAQKYFAIGCEDMKNKVAFQGTKQLSYRGPEGSGSCVYNWSKIAAIQKLTSLFESIAFTLEEGRRLQLERKHDRLALDAELGALLDAMKDGQAAEIDTIRPILQEIIQDEATLERAKLRAQKLLEDGGGNRASLLPRGPA
jgi:hypothetical protein